MNSYKKTDVSEARLEDLIRQEPGLIEEGLIYVDHQKQAAGGRLDVLLVDSGNSLVVAELKVVPDDGMLLQGLNYYDYVSNHVDALARKHNQRENSHKIDPTQQVRLLLIAPSFSHALKNCCKWIDVPITLFTYQCLEFSEKANLVPVYTDHPFPTRPILPDTTTIEDHLKYITEEKARSEARTLLDEIESWTPGNVTLDAIKNAISIWVNGKVFAYFCPYRKHYAFQTYNKAEDVWTTYPIKHDDDLLNVKSLLRTAMKRNMG